jgi:hypothetical protein
MRLTDLTGVAVVRCSTTGPVVAGSGSAERLIAFVGKAVSPPTRSCWFVRWLTVVLRIAVGVWML